MQVGKDGQRFVGWKEEPDSVLKYVVNLPLFSRSCMM